MLSDISNQVPTKNAGELAYIVDKEIQYCGTFVKIKISGHILLNQCGILLKQKKYQIKGIRLYKIFIQSICVTINGLSIPLMYPEGILSPSIHWKMEFEG